MIQFNKQPGQKILELGGGDNPHPDTDVNVDVRPGPKVNFTTDLEEPLPISSGEWDCVFSQYVIEHLSWRKVKSFLAEVFRILKPGGKCVFITANTEAQWEFIKKNPDGWDGKDSFESSSCVLFGDQDYEHNAHKNFMSPSLAQVLFSQAGFEAILTSPWGDRQTDMVIQATRPQGSVLVKPPTQEVKNLSTLAHESKVGRGKSSCMASFTKVDMEPDPAPEQLYDKHYFNGGSKVGGYAGEGYRDFPVHEITARHILSRKPESVLELGCARGYILKRIQDQGIHGCGLEVSKHCYLTRVADNIHLCDLLKTWPIVTELERGGFPGTVDLCYSVATLEHIPEQNLPDVIRNMKTHSKRGLHGVDFGEKDDGFDKTHCTLKPREWWVEMFRTHAPGYHVEILDKEELERGHFPEKVVKGDGKVKLNVGSFTTMFHHGWTNVDIHNLGEYANANGYHFLHRDVRQGLPFPTEGVDLIFLCHFLEHLTYEEGRRFLMECRRVIKPSGAMRILVPDAELLMGMYSGMGPALLQWEDLDEVNDGCANAKTPAAKLWALLHEGHHACYDGDTLVDVLSECGFATFGKSSFRKTNVPDHDGSRQILRETLDLFPCLTLYTEAYPLTS